VAQLALGAVGAGIGAAFGAPQLGWSVGVVAGGVLFGADQQHKREHLVDRHINGATYGAPIPQIYGAFRLAGNMIWTTDLVEHSHRNKSGKGAGISSTTRTYTYTVSFAMGICRAQLSAGSRIVRVYAEDKIIYDVNDPTVVLPATDLLFYTGDESQTPDPFMNAIQVQPAYRGLAYARFIDLDLTNWGNRIPQLSFEIDSGAGINTFLGDVLADVFKQVGLQPSDYDVSATNATVIDGLVINQRRTAALSIREILDAYFFDFVEVDGKIKAVALGTASQVTVPMGDLGAVAVGTGYTQQVMPAVNSTTYSDPGTTSPAGAPRVMTKRMHDLELPQRLELSYFSRQSLYNLVSASAIRYIKTHQNKGTLSFPLLLTENHARQIVESLLYKQWTERESFEFTLPLKYLLYMPMDVITIPVGGQELAVRITKQDCSLFGPVQFTAVLSRNDIFTQGQVVDAIVTPTVGHEISGTTLILISDNAVRDADTLHSGFYWAASGATSGDWPGCSLYWSRDGGTTYQLLDVTNDPATYGTVALATPAPPANVNTAVFDNTTTITVSITTGSPPTTTTDADVLGGANAAFVGQEVIQFGVVTPLGGSSYRLSHLLRGQRGTDAFWGSHGINETFLVIDPGQVNRVDLDETYRGKTIFFKGVTANQTLASTSAQSLFITGDEWNPYSGVQGVGVRNMSLDITVTWKWRTRSGGQLRDMSDVTDPDAPEVFSIDVLSGVTVVRTISAGPNPTFTYTAAQQTADFGSTQANIHFKIYQLGRYGRGYVYDVTL
jgi:hypothetical protein